MNPRLRLWWDCLPFTVKATLIALITGVVVTATARAATEDNDPARSALLTLHHPRVMVSDDDASAPTATITLASFEGDLTDMLQPTAMRERPGRDDRVHGRRAASARRRLSQVDHVAGDALDGFFHSLAQRRVREDVPRHFVRGQVPLLSQGQHR